MVSNDKDEAASHVRQLADLVAELKVEVASRVRAEAELRTITDNSGDAIWTNSLDGYYLYANPAACALTGHSIEELCRMRIAELVAPEDQPRLPDHIAALQETDHVIRNEWRLRRKDGDQVDVELTTQRLPDDRYLAIGRDVTERKRAEVQLTKSREELRALAAYQVAMIEEERKRLARELHDELGQNLTALNIAISNLSNELPSNKRLLDRTQLIQQIVDDTFKIVRNCAHTLRPPSLDIGIVTAIRSLAKDFRARWNIPCSVEAVPTDFQVEEAVAVAAYRIVQELLNNVARHSGARCVAVAMETDCDHLRVSVSDDGVGFDPTRLAVQGLGLTSMRERARELGGMLTVYSNDIGGTTVTALLPISSPVSP